MRQIPVALTAVLALLVALAGCAATREDQQWLIDTQQGCKIPMKYSEFSTELSWDGECDPDTGEAIGRGTLRWIEPDGSVGFTRLCMRPDHRLSKCSMGGVA